jgi:hypothetical protein
MEWVPASAWLTKIEIDANAPQIGFDLAVDASGAGAPSRVAAGLDLPGAVDPTVMAAMRWFAGISFVALGIGGIIWMIARHQIGSGLRPA